LDLGFDIRDRVTVLGMIIVNDTGNYDANATSIQKKVEKQVNFWKRFNLSLPGRIQVSKTMLYSQVNYLGCFMPLTNIQLIPIQLMIEKFVKGYLKLGKSRIYEKVSNGGLGLFNLQQFLSAQKCSWVMRAMVLDDCWKMNLYAGSYGSVLNLRSSQYTDGTVLHGIVSAWENFYTKYTAHHKNYTQAYMFGNPFFQCNQTKVNRELFGNNFFEDYRHNIQALSAHQLIREGNILGYEDAIRSTHIPFTQVHYIRLRGILDALGRNLVRTEQYEQVSTSILTFMARKTRGSRRYRKIIVGDEPDRITSNISKFSDNLEIVINLDVSKQLNCLWTVCFLDNSTRTFLFKFYNNILGYNHVVSHFVANHSPNCTFCDLTENANAERETPLHLFYQCESVENFLLFFFCWVTNSNVTAANMITRSQLFGIYIHENENKSRVLTIISKLILKYIWDSKLRFTLPVLAMAKTVIANELRSIIRSNVNFGRIFHSCEYDHIIHP
jgi:hypothetical protein